VDFVGFKCSSFSLSVDKSTPFDVSVEAGARLILPLILTSVIKLIKLGCVCSKDVVNIVIDVVTVVTVLA
jgi:hypothetical protein